MSITPKKFFDQAHPHHRKNCPSKSAKMGFFRLKIAHAADGRQKFLWGGVQKFLTFWGDPPTSHFCRHEVLGVFDFYSWRYKFLKKCKMLETGARFQSETGLWTGTLKILLHSFDHTIHSRSSSRKIFRCSCSSFSTMCIELDRL